MKGITNNPNGRPARSVEQMRAHLLAHRIISRDCWNWDGPLSEWGYGQLSWRGKHTMVHRISAIVWMGIAEDDQRLVLHRCDNPACFNPSHLFFGTDADNARDCTDKGRQYQQQKTHCARGHEFSPENTSIKRTTGKTGIGYERRCKTCHAEQQRARNRRLKCA